MNKGRRLLCRHIWPTSLLALALEIASVRCPTTAVAANLPQLSRTSVPASGRQECIATLPSFGRYALTVTSKQGSALQVIDRLAGPGPVSGAAGIADGRVDGFFERGSYKLITQGDKKASGEAALAVHAFHERNTPPRLLVETKLNSDTLADFEQRSYWLDVPKRRWVFIEAAGRHLADLRLWQNGDWLVDAAPKIDTIEPDSGHPLRDCTLVADLEPGLYLVTAYGGTSQPWANDDSTRPFHLRFGIPRRQEAARSRHTIGPFGTDRWILPALANYVRAEIPAARDLTLSEGPFRESNPLSTAETATINKTSLVPVAELETDRESEHIVSVSGAAGQPYILQHFDSGTFTGWTGRSWRVLSQGPHWVSTIHAGDASDSVDATGILIDDATSNSIHTEPLATQLIEIDSSHPWARRANVLDHTTIFFRVAAAGSYRVVTRGANVKFRFEPFLRYHPTEYEPPAWTSVDAKWELDAGIYVLSLEPESRGVLDVAIVAPSDESPAAVLERLLPADRTKELQRLQPNVELRNVSLFQPDKGHVAELYLNQQPGVPVGLVLRPLPVDLENGLPISQRPDDPVTVSVRSASDGILRGETDAGATVLLSVDDQAASVAASIKAGVHTVKIAATDTPRNLSLSVEQSKMQPRAPLPPLPDPSRATPPKLPVVAPDAPTFFDLDRQESRTFLVNATKPALYRLQSTGLLAVSGNLRTRMNPSFVRARDNGAGRNFYIDQYLREGDYQLTLKAEGQSRGHLGLTLERTELSDGGRLNEGFPARTTLGAGQAIRYTFDIDEPGEYRVRSLALSGSVRCRLEDGEGWPIETPNIGADLSRFFDKGHYQIILLPEAIEGRRLTLLERVPQPTELLGHGPHPLPFDQGVEHVWREPVAGQERLDDAWTFSLPAAADITVAINGEMEGSLYAEGHDPAVATLKPGHGWNGSLTAGNYVLRLHDARIDDQATYTLRLSSRQLLAGQDRDLTPPASLDVAVGRDGLVQLASFGSTDVRAALFDQNGNRVASNDDGPDDWNFQLQQPLQAGTYRLQVDPVRAVEVHSLQGSAGPATGDEPNAEAHDDESVPFNDAARDGNDTTVAGVRVSMRAPQEIAHGALALPAQFKVAVSRDSQVYDINSTGDLLIAGVKSAESVVCAIERHDDNGWRVLVTNRGSAFHVAAPLNQAPHRLRLWSLDGRPAEAELSVVAHSAAGIAESAIKNGAVVFQPIAGLTPPLGSVTIRLAHDGLFRVAGHDAMDCSDATGGCDTPVNGLAAARGTFFHLLGPAGQHATLQRVVLGPGDQRAVQPEVRRSTTVDLDAPTGSAVIALATTTVGQPGVRLDEPAAYTARAHAAVAASLATQSRAAVVWSADRQEAPILARLQQFTFAQPKVETASLGGLDITLAKEAARRFDLPTGWKRVHLALQPGLVAVLSNGEHIKTVHWSGDEAADETLDSDADRLTVFQVQGNNRQLRVETVALTEPTLARAIDGDHPFEWSAAAGGILRLRVEDTNTGNGDTLTLHVRGASGDALLLNEDGRITQGSDLTVTGTGGNLIVPHSAGTILAWLNRGTGTLGLWTTDTTTPETTVRPPAVIPLAGASQRLRLDAEPPIVVHIRAAVPAISAVLRGSDEPEVAVHSKRVVLDTYVERPDVLIGLRALGGRALSGTAELTTSPVSPIGEGLGAQVLLAAGTTRFFSFKVAQQGAVGVGVRAAPDRVDVVLYTADGKQLSTGTVQMPDLAPGTYLLAVHAPGDGGPVLVRPALAGVTAPSTGPPNDVIRTYIDGAVAPPTPVASEDED